MISAIQKQASMLQKISRLQHDFAVSSNIGILFDSSSETIGEQYLRQWAGLDGWTIDF